MREANVKDDKFDFGEKDSIDTDCFRTGPKVVLLESILGCSLDDKFDFGEKDLIDTDCFRTGPTVVLLESILGCLRLFVLFSVVESNNVKDDKFDFGEKETSGCSG